MEQAPKPAEAPQAKGKKTWVIVAGVVIIVIVVIAGLYFAGYLGRTGGGSPVRIWENPVGSCGSSNQCGYDPNPKNVTAGTTIEWTNEGTLPHTVTACHTANAPSSTACPTMNAASLPNFDSGASPQLSGGQKFSNRFDTAGTYYYFCIVHPSQMHGTVIVS